MATNIPQSQSDGALYELVARGKKDIYFITSNPADAIYPFSNQYNKIEPRLIERRTHISRNAPQFKQSIEFDIDRYGDTLTDLRLLISMPTWLPQLHLSAEGLLLPPEDVNRALLISAQDGYCYGWVRNIGYYIIETLELFQDKILIYQTTGEALWLSQITEDSDSSASLRQNQTGQHFGTPHQVAMNATLDKLYINIPFIGKNTPHGFPLMSILGNTFRVKIKLRNAEHLIEAIPASTSTIINAPTTPWNQMFKYEDINGVLVTFQALGKDAMKPPIIVLESHQAYLREEMRAELNKSTFKWESTFKRWFINKFPIDENIYAPFDKGGPVIITRRLDGAHPTERILFIVRSQADIQCGNLWKIMGSATPANTSGSYWSTVKFMIAGCEREFTWPTLVWKDLASLKTQRPLLEGMGSINFSIEADKENGGTINMSQADRPSIQIQLLDAGSRRTEIMIVTEAKAVYCIEGGRGYVKFIN
jgi:hypothetical protein